MRRTWIEVIPPTLARWRITARCSGELSCFRAFDILPLHIPQKEQGQHQRCLRVAVGEHEQGPILSRSGESDGQNPRKAPDTLASWMRKGDLNPHGVATTGS